MVKEPHPGRVKTRLGREIGYIEAAHWYRHETLRTIRRLRSPKWDLILAVSPDGEGLTSRIWPAHIPRIAQGRGDLGMRMARLLRTFSPAPVCIIGSDIPAIRPDDIAAAFAGLGSHSATIGPSPDGGYWLVGVKNTRALPSGFMKNVRWSSRFARADTVATAPDLSWHIGRSLNDIDTLDDLLSWQRENARA
ncbi:TIGR04282 family arsenosugar biosynthesis glycosyltransferase [Celeribacter sp.]|uniref:TIGR04282 family arsenosugar biosynthesis glycosyltransferase n=1 Tax=Celeribacter sp. TaxID=1890673 RepID=UPI003A8F4578